MNEAETIQQLIQYNAADGNVAISVNLANDTVWLSLNDLVQLFERDKSVISRHISTIYKEGELVRDATVAKYATVQKEGGREISRDIEYFNLDVIISVGYRVKSKTGTQFRIWATNVLKSYLLRGYAVQNRIENIEKKLFDHDTKIEFLLNTNLPLNQGIFYDGQIFDAYVFISKIIKSAQKSIVLIDNYIDESVLMLLSKRETRVKVTIYTDKIDKPLQLDIDKYNLQYNPITAVLYKKSHDRFLIIDQKTVYHIGASLKDLGKKWFAFSKLNLDAGEIISRLGNSE